MSSTRGGDALYGSASSDASLLGVYLGVYLGALLWMWSNALLSDGNCYGMLRLGVFTLRGMDILDLDT
jgi:hypothetical protein